MPFTVYENSYIHCRDHGAGSPVVALHGSASTSSQWESLTGYLAGRFRVIRPDLPGYGKSSPIARGDMNLTAIAVRISDLLHEIGEPVHLVGHSFGGAVALKLAHMMPHLIRSLVVIEPAAFHLLANEAGARRHFDQIMSVVDAMQRARIEGDTGTAMARFIDFWNGHGAWTRTSHGLRGKLAGTTGQVMDDFVAIAAETATFADYAAIRCPVLAVTGRQSPEVTQYLTERLAGSLPASELAEIVDAGHMAPLTDPHVVDPMITAHILAAEHSSRIGNAVYREAA